MRGEARVGSEAVVLLTFWGGVINGEPADQEVGADMSGLGRVCERARRGGVDPGEWLRRLDDGGADGYHLVVTVPKLPEQVEAEDRRVRHGYSVRLADRWFWFPALEPAVAFGRAGRMSGQGSGGWSLHRAAAEVTFCELHFGR